MPGCGGQPASASGLRRTGAATQNGMHARAGMRGSVRVRLGGRAAQQAGHAAGQQSCRSLCIGDIHVGHARQSQQVEGAGGKGARLEEHQQAQQGVGDEPAAARGAGQPGMATSRWRSCGASAVVPGRADTTAA